MEVVVTRSMITGRRMGMKPRGTQRMRRRRRVRNWVSGILRLLMHPEIGVRVFRRMVSLVEEAEAIVGMLLGRRRSSSGWYSFFRFSGWVGLCTLYCSCNTSGRL